MDLYEEIKKILKSSKLENVYGLWYVDENKEVIKLSPKYNLRFKDDDIIDIIKNNRSEEKIHHKTIKDYNVYIFKYRFNKTLVIITKLDQIKKQELEKIYIEMLYLYIDETEKIRKFEKDIFLNNLKKIDGNKGTQESLKLIIETIIQLDRKFDSGIIHMFNEKLSRLEVLTAVGFDDEIYGFNPKLNESIVGMVFRKNIARYYNTSEEVQKVLDNSNISYKNIRLLQDNIGNRNLKGLVSLPILYKGNKIGVLTMYKFKSNISIDDRDVELLECFSSQIAMIVENKRLELEKLKSENKIDKLNNFIKRRDKIYEDLKNLSLMNKGLVEIVRSLSRTLEVGIILYSKLRNNISFNNLNDKKDEMILKEILEYEKKDIGLTESQYDQYYYFPIKNGNVFLGYLIIDKKNTSIQVKNIIHESLPVVVIELMKDYILEDIKSKKTYENYTKLINSKDKRVIDRYRRELYLPEGKWYMSILIGIRTYSDLQGLQMINHNLMSIIKQEFANINKIVFGFHNTVNLTIYSKERIDYEIIKSKLRKLIEVERKINDVRLSIGVGSYYNAVDLIEKSYKESEIALSYIMSRKDIDLIEYNDIGINRLFIHHVPEDVDKFLEDVLGGLDTEEAIKSNLDKTLATYIDTNKSAVETAEKLHIHINTFYNRLKKIEKILNVNFDNPQDNLKVQLACHLRRNRDNIIV